MTQVREINRVEDLIEYRQVWADLLASTPSASFFQAFDWFLCYWQHFGQTQRLRILVVSDQGVPIGIVPLVVRREQTRAGKVAVLTYPLHDWGSFYAPLGPQPGTTLQAGLRHVAATRRDWDLLDLRWVEPHQDGGLTPAALTATGFTPHPRAWDTTALIDLSGGWDNYWNSRTSKFRNNIRRFERRLSEAGELRYLRYRPPGEAAGDCDPRWDLYQTCVDLARHSWQGSSTTGTTISHESIREFLTDVHAVAARHGSLDLNLLLIDGRPVAFAYNYYRCGKVLGLRVGFDADAARDGAGNVLYMRILEDSCRRGDQLYDMGPGSLDIKQKILTHTVTSYRYTHFAPFSLKAQLLRLKRHLDHRRTDAALDHLAATVASTPSASEAAAPEETAPAGV